MVDLTVIILTKNEEKNIRKCISSFRGTAKRFVIVDSFSTDRTEEICRELDRELKPLGGCVDFYQNTWVNYATQLNWGIDHTNISTTWSMRMDADEELLPELAEEINQKLEDDSIVSEDIRGIILKRRLIFMGKWIRHGGRYPEYLLRIWRTGMARCEQKVMDEHMILSGGKTLTFQHDLQDNNQKDLAWWTAKHNWYSSREVLDHQEYLESLEGQGKRSASKDDGFQAKGSVTKSYEMQGKSSGQGSTDISNDTSVAIFSAETENGNGVKEVKKANLESGGASTKQAEQKRKIKNGGYYRLPKFFRAHLYFIYRYYIRLGFLDGPEGKIFHYLQAYWYRFLVDAKLYECEKNGTKMEEQGELKA